MRKTPWATTTAFAVALLAAGCGGEPAVDRWAAVAAAPAAAEIGPGGTAGCETMPVTLSIPARWKPEAVDRETAVMFNGDVPILPVCELKPLAGGLYGLARIWAGPATDARSGLAEYLAADQKKATDIEYRDITVAGAPAVEARYHRPAGELTDETTVPVFAIMAGDQVVIFIWNGFDEEDRLEGQSAYELAKSSMKPVPTT